MPKLDNESLQTALKTLPAWQLEQGMLVRDIKFSNFKAAMAFVNQIADMAESANHHPDIDIRYDKVRLCLISHDSGGITNRDVHFATKVEASFPKN